MTLSDIILRRPGPLTKIGIWLLAFLALGIIGYLHLLSGLAYEFHLFFIIPVLAVAWFVSTRRAYVIGLLAVILWYLADRQLGGEGGERLPLLFNTLVRLGIFFGAVWLLGRMQAILQREARMAREDVLTGLSNRRGFTRQGEILLAMTQRQNLPVSALFIDLDHFKEINDHLGHDAGDALLVRIAEVLRSHLRASDLAGRLGGDEFALILPGSDCATAAAYAENLRQRLLEAVKENGWPVTFSIGVASFAIPPAGFEKLLNAADKLMYEVKNDGRNRVLARNCDSGPA